MDFSVMVSPRFYTVFWMTDKSMHAWIFFVLFWVLVGRFFHAPNWWCGGIFRAPHFPIPGGRRPAHAARSNARIWAMRRAMARDVASGDAQSRTNSVGSA